MSEPTLRPYRPGDIDKVMLVEDECFPPWQRYSRSTVEALLSMRGSRLIVAEVNGDIAGYSLGYMEGWSVGHIASLAVRPAYRRRGIGTALMLRLESELASEGAYLVRLEVSVNNEVAKSLYLKLGYRPVRLLPGYYSGVEDGLLMEKELPDS